MTAIPLLLDSSFIVDLLRGRAKAIALAEQIDASGETPQIPAPALYEVRAGLLYQGSRAQAARFTAMLRTFPVAAFDASAAEKAAEVQAEALREGDAHGEAGAMILGIALASGHELLTRDEALLASAAAFGARVRTY